MTKIIHHRDCTYCRLRIVTRYPKKKKGFSEVERCETGNRDPRAI